MAFSLDTSGFNVTVPQGNSPLESLKPFSMAGASPMQIKPLAGWSIPSAQPELVAQGISQGLGAIGQGIQVAYQQRKQDIKDARDQAKLALDAKKEQDRYDAQQRSQDYRDKMMLLRIKGVQPKDIAGAEEESASAEEAHNFLNTKPTPDSAPLSKPVTEPQFQRDTAPGSITIEPKKLGMMTPGSILTPEAQQENVDRQAASLSAMTIPGLDSGSVTYQPAPKLANTQPPVLVPSRDINTNPAYLGTGTPAAVNPGNTAADQYHQATAMPSPTVQATPTPTPAPTPSPTPEPTPTVREVKPAMTSEMKMVTKDQSAAPVTSPTPAPPQEVQAAAPPTPPAPSVPLDPSKQYATPSELMDAFKKIKAPDTREYEAPKYSVFKSPQDAALYASKFSNPDYEAAKVDSKPDKSGFYHITWKNVRDARLKTEAAAAEHATKHIETAERLGRMNEAGIKAQVDDFNSDPQIKLMTMRGQQIPAFFNVSQMALSGDPNKSRRVLDLDAIDSFVAFARGTQPTESQYSEIQNYTQGFLADLRQKIDKGAEGARLSENDIRTMRALMVENYNGNANVLNPDIQALRENYVAKHPGYRPEELPLEFKPLLSEEYMKNEIANAQRDMRQYTKGMQWSSEHNKPQLHSELKKKYDQAVADQYKFDAEMAQASESQGLPVNWTQWTHSRRGGWMRGFHGGVPDNASVPTTP